MKVKLGVAILAGAAALALGAGPVSADSPTIVCDSAKGVLYPLPDPGDKGWVDAVQQCLDDRGHPSGAPPKK